jgi:hypothetical protein
MWSLQDRSSTASVSPPLACRLARAIRGIGFKSTDRIALRLGIEKTAMIRAQAGISYALAEAMDEGHCGLPTEELQALAATLLEIPAEVVDAALALELAKGAVAADTVAGRPCLFLARLHRAEQGIAERLRRSKAVRSRIIPARPASRYSGPTTSRPPRARLPRRGQRPRPQPRFIALTRTSRVGAP